MATINPPIIADTSKAISFEFNQSLISNLDLNPNTPIVNKLFGNSFKAEIIIPEYFQIIQQYYHSQIKYSIKYYHDNLNLPPLFSHFGICITFEKSTKIHIHDTNMVLSNSVKTLLIKYGAVILKNVYLDAEMRDMGHRNRFPQLNFHIDRNPMQLTHFSVYTRNPFDEEQKHPRSSSTLFIPYLVGYLQGLKEGKDHVADKNGLITSSVLYQPTAIPELLNSIILPHSWNESENTGEISIIDNINILHASYYPNEFNKGYRIGVRYVS
jgi:hypothetical protein